MYLRKVTVAVFFCIVLFTGYCSTYLPRKYNENCHSKFLSDGQKEFCENNSKPYEYMLKWASEAKVFCKYLTSLELWNCDHDDGPHSMLKLDDGGTPGSAFVSAMRAAGLTLGLVMGYYSGYMNCFDNDLQPNRTSDQGWKIVEVTPCFTAGPHVEQVITDFTDMDREPEESDDGVRSVMRHNARVGIRTIIDNIVHRCRFVRGCEECLTIPPYIEDISRILYEKYNTSRKVKPMPMFGAPPQLIYADSKKFIHPTVSELVHMISNDLYPDYCRSHKVPKRLCYRHIEGDPKLTSEFTHAKMNVECKRLCCHTHHGFVVKSKRAKSCSGCILEECYEPYDTCYNVTVHEYHCP